MQPSCKCIYGGILIRTVWKGFLVLMEKHRIRPIEKVIAILAPINMSQDDVGQNWAYIGI